MSTTAEIGAELAKNPVSWRIVVSVHGKYGGVRAEHGMGTEHLLEICSKHHGTHDSLGLFYTRYFQKSK